MTLPVYEIEIKKIILSGLQSSGYSLNSGIESVIQGYLNFPVASPSTASLQTASQYIVAFLQLGFSYMEHKELFDFVLKAAGYSDEFMLSMQKQNTLVTIGKQQIRALLGRWPASPYNSHTIMSAVNDIISHVSSKIPGTYHYYTAKKDGTFTALYQLDVSADYALFHNIYRNKYYSLVEK